MNRQGCDYISIALDDMEKERPLTDEEESTVWVIHFHLHSIYSDVTLEYIEYWYRNIRDNTDLPIRHLPDSSHYIHEKYHELPTAENTGEYTQYLYTDSQGLPLPHTKIDGEPDVFIVDKKLDFIFTYIFDMVTIMKYYHGKDENSLIQLANDRFSRRVQLLKLCDDDNVCVNMMNNSLRSEHHDLCSLCCVLYTRLDSEFYRKCKQRLQSVRKINFTASPYEFLDIEHILFTQIIFLCGNQLLPEERFLDRQTVLYSGIHQWVKVPLWFLLLIPTNEKEII